MTNMGRPFWILLPLLAMFLAPTDAWKASVSQNLFITVTRAAAPTVTIKMASPSSLSAQPGGTITYTTIWQGGPTASSYEIFTHFTDTSGNNLFQDTDHFPNPLTTSWSSSPYTETRTVTVPSTIAPGTYNIMAGLFSGATRLTLNPGPGVTADDQIRYNIDTLTVTAATQPAFYVATNGSDSNAGTLAAPFATLGKCQSAMQASSTKTCYIRAGTYTGSGVGYNTVTTTTYFSVTEALYLTSADNGETWSYYAPDGVDTAIFEGHAGTNGANCPQLTGITGVERGIYTENASNITINGLQFQNFCFSGITLHAGADRTANCTPTFFSENTTGNLIENNIIHDIYNGNSQCGNSSQFVGATAPIAVYGANNTVTHNVVYNATGFGVISGGNSTYTISGLTFSYNLVYNVNTAYYDAGGIYVGQDTTATNINVLYNYVNTFGVYGCVSTIVPGQCVNAYYNDDGASNITRMGNVATGGTGSCYFSHGGSTVNDSGNICDLGNVARATTYSSHGWIIANGPNDTGSASNQHNIVIASASTCAGQSNQCALQNIGYPGTVTIGPNDYWNYNASGNRWLNTGAINNGDRSPNNVDAFGNSTTRCPRGNINSWGYYIPPGNAVFSAPVSFPAQPAGWATPGFWGPPGYVVPHFGNSPSYGPTC
jgi:hypothetical protein